MLYSDVPGPSSGRLGPFVGDVFQDIRPDEKKSESCSSTTQHSMRSVWRTQSLVDNTHTQNRGQSPNTSWHALHADNSSTALLLSRLHTIRLRLCVFSYRIETTPSHSI